VKIARQPLRLKPWYGLICIVMAIGCLGITYSFRMLRASFVLGFRNGKPRPLRIYDRFFGYHPAMTDLSIPGAMGQVQLRVYSPAGDRHPMPILMVHGFAPDGNKDGYLNRVAFSLTEMGYMVILPNVPAETHFEMRASDLTVIADAIRWSANTTGQKVSVFGISFGAGLAIPAAVQPSVAGDVKLIFSLSGYNDLDSIARYYLHDRVNDPSGSPYPGNPPGPLVIVSPYLGELVPPRDFPALRKELDLLKQTQGRKLTDNDPSVVHLSDSQQKELTELETVNTAQMHQLYLDTLIRHRAEIAAISPSSVLRDLKVPLFVLHGQNDPVFPEGEIEWMRKEVAGNRNAHILVSPWIAHAFVGQPATRWEKLRVIYFGSQLLHAASRPSPIAH
jgi:pimeloyl-ACP methyl ester carboxylesterase